MPTNLRNFCQQYLILISCNSRHNPAYWERELVDIIYIISLQNLFNIRQKEQY